MSLLLPFPYLLLAQDGAPEASDEDTVHSGEERERRALESSLESLGVLSQAIEVKEDEIAATEKEIEEADIEAEKELLQTASKRLQQELVDLKSQFETVAGGGVDITRFEEEPAEPLDLQSEVVKLLQPLIDDAKKATETPREIERLKEELEKFSEREQLAKGAVAELERVSEANENEPLGKRLSQTLTSWRTRQQEAEDQIKVISHQLETISAQQRPFIDTTREMALGFFRSRGVNLLLGIAAFFVVYAALRFVYRQFHRMEFFKKGGRTFGGRLVDVLYQVFVFVAALFSMVMVFYVANDFMLLGLIVLFVAGISWSGVKFLPGYLEQVRLMLNLGPVRENERVVFDGLPWKLETLNFQCRLVNPDLEGGVLRLPVKSLIGLYSRPCVENESWFPCSVGDWVRLENGTCGRVLWQTMEMVRLEPLGKAPVTYQTGAFLSLNPQNLSGGFRISTTFGIDYRHQQESTSTIPALMKEGIREGLADFIEAAWIRGVDVQLKEAAASSINYDIDVDVTGEAAPCYESLERGLTKILVDACNRHRWSIPFTQITLHQAGAEG